MGDIRIDQMKVAETAAQELLRAVRELGGSRPGEYTVRARLLADGSYHWTWSWWPPTDKQGSQGGVLPE
jgi:hypothetical protein